MIKMKQRRQREELQMYYRQMGRPAPSKSHSDRSLRHMRTQLELCLEILAHCDRIVDDKLQAKTKNGLEAVVPNLSSIILTGNNLQELSDLEPLGSFTKLETICLLINPVSTKTNYREYMAYKFPHMRLLDFRKIKQKDRQGAQEFFRTKQGKDILREVSKKSKLSAAAALAAEASSGKGLGSDGGRFANPV
ncbi:probable U2 small nuclear ribonucleoprotein A' [Drosophila miranda]|uniref:probable U2 small nuclear ribonucleoprotein A' n=1 Tax=Drosophila miranda TaxID=7229 RepID=UPI00143F5B4E|nr:probable U2 small nuclear ribonucleoprotein A' [Drosophila miranda]